jgi:hypothetical protein
LNLEKRGKKQEKRFLEWKFVYICECFLLKLLNTFKQLKVGRNDKNMKMKTIIYSLLFINSFSIFSQNYALDYSYGINGIKEFYSLSNFRCKGGLIINGNYYLISENQIIKINYQGDFDNNFGINGIISLNTISNIEFKITNIKFLNGYFYLYGSKTNLSNNSTDLFILKINEFGNYDMGFGTNGFAVIDFGSNEVISDFVFDASGNLFCIGSQYQGVNSVLSKLIYFKINPNGYLINTFGVNGYNFFIPTTNVPTGAIRGYFIDNYNSKYLLVGHLQYSYANNILNLVIDENGIVDTNYNIVGHKLIQVESGYSFNIGNVQKIGNNLFVNYFRAFNSYDAYYQLLNYDLGLESKIFDNYSLYYSNFKVEGNSIFTTGYTNCQNVCARDFILRKHLDNFNLDSSFANNGLYSYNRIAIPNTNATDDISSFFIKDSADRFLICGNTSDNNGVNSFNPRFYTLRIGDESTLNINDFNQHSELSLSPNPFYDKIGFNFEDKIKSIEIFDLIGKKINEPKYEVVNNYYNLDFQKGIEKGTYLIKITTVNNQVFLKKIIKI